MKLDQALEETLKTSALNVKKRIKIALSLMKLANAKNVLMAITL